MGGIFLLVKNMLDIIVHSICELKFEIKLILVELNAHICKVDYVHHVPFNAVSLLLPIYG